MTKTQLNDLFDRMEPEEGNELDDKINVEKDELTDKLIEKIFLIDFRDYLMYKNEKELFNYLETIDSSSHSSKSITKLSYHINDEIINDSRAKEDLGIYFSYLIEKSPDKNHKLIFTNINTRLSGVGFINTKNITVFGNLGDCTGAYMKSGEIRITGSVGDITGFGMEEGTIIVEGNAGNNTGGRMKNGNIYVNGNITSTFKRIILPGRILPNIDMFLNSEKYGQGNIYHKDKLIVKKGEIIDEAYLR